MNNRSWYGASLAILLVLSTSILGCRSQQIPNDSPPLRTVPLIGGFVLMRPQTGPMPAPVVDWNGTQMVQYKIAPGQEGMLVAPQASLTGFRQLSLRLWSQQKAVIAVIIEDRDKAKFHAIKPLAANCWTDISLVPNDFQINDDSPVKKNALDPQLVVGPTILAQISKRFGLQETNTLGLSSMKVAYGQTYGKAGRQASNQATNPVQSSAILPVPEFIDGTTVTLSHSGVISHPITIRHGGKLILDAPTIHLAGDINLDGSALEIRNTSLVVDNKFPHEFKLNAENRSTIILDKTNYSSAFMTGLDVKNSSLNMKNCRFHDTGFTCAPENSTVSLVNTAMPGEFVVQPGNHYKFSGCESTLLWLRMGEGRKADVALPIPPMPIKKFTLPPETGLDLSIIDSKMIMWSLITTPGADVTIRNSDIRATGMAFPDSATIKIADLKNDADARQKDTVLNVADRKLSFVNTAVHSFCFYPLKQSHLEISNCTFGEIIASMQSHVVITNSTCDGTAGYVRVNDKGEIHLTNCTINCSLVAINEGRLFLDHCTVNGDTSAADDSLITLHDSVIKGRRLELGRGRIKVES